METRDCSCPSASELEEFQAGTLIPESHDRIARHLLECPRCDPKRRTTELPSERIDSGGNPVDSELVVSGIHQVDQPPVAAPPLGPRGSPATVASQFHSQPSDPLKNESLPEKIGKYFVLDRLGKGGFAEVYLAKDPDQERRFVAVKIPRRDKEFRRGSAIDRFLKEARASASIRHPRIVQVYDWDRDELVHCFVVMQCIRGRTLAEVFKSERPDPTRLCDILIDVAEALQYIHSLGQVHRDVKPANILVDGRAWLSDFGLSFAEDERWAHANERAGTANYMAPEQIRGESPLYRGFGDVWSFGVVFYEGLTGKKPFFAGNRAQLFNDIANGIPRRPRDLDASIPEALERVCLKCLEKQPGDRCDMGQALRALKRWRRGQRSRPWLIAAAPALLLSAIILAIVAYHRVASVPDGDGNRPPQVRPEPNAVDATSIPVVAYASNSSKNSICRVNEVDNTVQLVSDNLFLVKLGRLDLAESAVRLTIKPIAEGAEAGVFIGFRDRKVDGDRQFQRIRIVKQNDGVSYSRRTSFVFDPANPEAGDSFGFPPLRFDDAQRDNTVEVRTKAGQLTQIWWNGKLIEDVNFAGFDAELLDVTGLFGVYTDNSAAVFSRFEVNGRPQVLRSDRSDR
jgi:serine/threonine protein kinase